MEEETRVGISAYLNPSLQRFQGILKHKYNPMIWRIFMLQIFRLCG